MPMYSDPPPEETRVSEFALTERFRSQPKLRWTDQSGDHEAVVEGRVLLGSSSDSGIVVREPTVSRLHAELDVRGDGLWVRDLNSRNGTFIDGIRITGARIPDHSKLRLGSTDIVVDLNPGRVRPVELWPSSHFGKLIGRSASMRELFATLGRFAPMDSSVLIFGETGTGKELVARAIHDASARAAKPFVIVDCAAFAENLLDAELFGHAKGAFTGALGARAGAIESADGGTVFLDEIGELPISMQPKLLRVLESRTVRRVGETAHRKVDVRFISATHRDLLTMVAAGEFREDLYFRLAVLPVVVPALRERPEDIEPLVYHFLNPEGGTAKPEHELVRTLSSRPWRGNVRELRNFVERARALGPTRALELMQNATSGGSQPAKDSASPGAQPASPPAPPVEPTAAASAATATSSGLRLDDDQIFSQTYKAFRESLIDLGEKEYVRRLLLRHDRNVAAAAKEAEVDRTYIYRLIRKHEL